MVEVRVSVSERVCVSAWAGQPHTDEPADRPTAGDLGSVRVGGRVRARVRFRVRIRV